MKEKFKEYSKVFWVFVLGCILGVIFETIIVVCQKGHIESRQGLIYGPFSPVYGIGGVIYYLVFKKINTRNKLTIFLIAMLLGGTTEFICSLLQEEIFGSISWDYSYLPFNFNGRTSLLHCVYWGIAGLLYITCIEPLINKMNVHLDKAWVKKLTIIFSIFMIFNIIISSTALIRQQNRRKNIPAQNSFDTFLDENYPDELMDRIYANKRNR